MKKEELFKVHEVITLNSKSLLEHVYITPKARMITPNEAESITDINQKIYTYTSMSFLLFI